MMVSDNDSFNFVIQAFSQCKYVFTPFFWILALNFDKIGSIYGVNDVRFVKNRKSTNFRGLNKI